MLRRSRLLILVLFALPELLSAQARLDCPRPVRERRYHNAPKPYLELGAGLSRPLLYRNAAGPVGEPYRFISRLTPYASAIGFLPLSERLAIFAGASVMQTWQGLGFDYSDGNGALRVHTFAGSLVATIPAGIRYRAGQRLLLNAGPYISYATHTGQSDASQSSGAGGTTSRFSYRSPDQMGLNAGLRLAADISLTRRLALSLTCAADALRSAPSYSRIDLGNRTEKVYEGNLEPHLLHAGAGISYRLFGTVE